MQRSGTLNSNLGLAFLNSMVAGCLLFMTLGPSASVKASDVIIEMPADLDLDWHPTQILIEKMGMVMETLERVAGRIDELTAWKDIYLGFQQDPEVSDQALAHQLDRLKGRKDQIVEDFKNFLSQYDDLKSLYADDLHKFSSEQVLGYSHDEPATFSSAVDLDDPGDLYLLSKQDRRLFLEAVQDLFAELDPMVNRHGGGEGSGAIPLLIENVKLIVDRLKENNPRPVLGYEERVEQLAGLIRGENFRLVGFWVGKINRAKGTVQLCSKKLQKIKFTPKARERDRARWKPRPKGR